MQNSTEFSSSSFSVQKDCFDESSSSWYKNFTIIWLIILIVLVVILIIYLYTRETSFAWSNNTSLIILVSILLIFIVIYFGFILDYRRNNPWEYEEQYNCRSRGGYGWIFLFLILVIIFFPSGCDCCYQRYPSK
jgi:amino acid transporter